MVFCQQHISSDRIVDSRSALILQTPVPKHFFNFTRYRCLLHQTKCFIGYAVVCYVMGNVNFCVLHNRESLKTNKGQKKTFRGQLVGNLKDNGPRARNSTRFLASNSTRKPYHSISPGPIPDYSGIPRIQFRWGPPRIQFHRPPSLTTRAIKSNCTGGTQHPIKPGPQPNHKEGEGDSNQFHKQDVFQEVSRFLCLLCNRRIFTGAKSDAF